MTALEGLRILDMTQWEAGPSCTQALAWLGADVVKVEPPEGGDPGRRVRGDDGTDSEYFLNWNSNKRSVALDLRTPRGREILLAMAPHYDVFVENYGPGVTEKLDIGYDVMRQVNPEIIYVRIKGFGTDGPKAHYKSMDMVAQAAAGAFSVTGEADGPPMRPGPTVGDAGTGMQAALAVVAAWAQKLRTGKGQLVELSMQEATIYYLRTAVSRTRFGEVPTPRTGNGDHPLFSLYPCAPGGPNDHVFIMAPNPRMWETLCRTIGRADLIEDPRFATPEGRGDNGAALFGEIAAWTAERTKQECMETLSEAGVCASSVYETHDLFRDPHLLARGFVHEVHHPHHGDVRLLGWAPRMARSEVALTAAPLLGEHTDEVLAADLGLGGEELASLREAGVVAVVPTTAAAAPPADGDR
ncbi:MAG: CoA transferase [Thermoanaerobaculia bacterium]|nr:CoA transferase [Thermoanaerobaculia bacterium]